MTQIKKLNQTTFYLETRGNKMMLTQRKTCYGKVWEMYIDNPSRSTKKSLAVKEFDTLKEVESYYKSWVGLSLISGSG